MNDQNKGTSIRLLIESLLLASKGIVLNFEQLNFEFVLVLRSGLLRRVALMLRSGATPQSSIGFRYSYFGFKLFGSGSTIHTSTCTDPIFIKEVTHLPVIVDPSHGTGKLSLIEPMSLAAVAAGADGLIIEVHYNPAEALSDKDQSMPPEMFDKTTKKILSLRDFIKKIG